MFYREEEIYVVIFLNMKENLWPWEWLLSGDFNSIRNGGI